MSGEGDLSDSSSREHWEEVWAKADPDRVSWSGARGLMQILPRTARELGIDNIADPESSVHGGVKYIARDGSVHTYAASLTDVKPHPAPHSDETGLSGLKL